jgi:hypothetical protein
VIVDDFEIGGRVFNPSKTNAVLSIDPNAKFPDSTGEQRRGAGSGEFYARL